MTTPVKTNGPASMEPGFYVPTDRTTLSRLPARGRYDRATVHAILDEALVAHVGFVADGQPFVLPMAFGRSGEELYLHGAARGRIMAALGGGGAIAVSVTLLDGLVLARSAFHHSVNYRSVVILGRGRLVSDPEEKRRALAVIVDHLVGGRTGEARQPTAGELAATAVVAVALDEVSAKVRSGPPVDSQSDLGYPTWAGEIPLRLTALAPIAAPDLPKEVAASPSVQRFIDAHREVPRAEPVQPQTKLS